jgi:ParB-like chromosome segregation protein Spo0J
VVDEDGVIIVGHTRYKAALKLGLEEVPVHVAVGMSEAQAKAYRIADNQTATLSAWDDDNLPLELAQLQQMDFDLNLTGFSADELMRLLDSGTNAGQTDPDTVPEPPDEAITQPGDLWLLGKHRLLCGDSSKPEDVDRLLDGASIHLVSTDPPYNVRVEPRSNNAISAGLSSFQGTTHHQSLDVARHLGKSQPTTKKLRAKDRPLANDFVSDEEFDRLLHAVRQPGPRAAAGAGLLHLGRLCECGELSAGLEGDGAVLLPGHHLGQAASRPDAEGLHGRPRVVLLRLAGRRCSSVLWSHQRHRPVVDQEGQSPEHGASLSAPGRAGADRCGFPEDPVHLGR